MQKRKFWKRILALSLAGMLVMSNSTLLASAEELTSEETNMSRNSAEALVNYQVTLDEVDFPDNEELFSGYAERIFYGSSEISTYGNFHGDRLEGQDKIIYDILKEQIEAVAAGEQSSTVFAFPMSQLNIEKTKLTAADLGVNSIIENGELNSEACEKAFEIWLTFTPSEIMRSLLNDCPYELYWFDKTQGIEVRYNAGVTYTDQYIQLDLDNIVKFTFCVADEYATTDSAGNKVMDVQKAKAVQKSADNAKKIVDKYKDLSDYEKLKTYKEKICSLTSYNHSAVENSNTPYGNPWQLIWVFDEDPNTNVVCEGYSKAFQYLFDMSSFKSSKVGSYLTEGKMNGGNHMWNTVQMENGFSYLVDVTNCDEGTIGNPDHLFLASAKSGSVDTGFDFTAGGTSVKYLYADEMKEMYGEILDITKTPYTPGQAECNHTWDSGKVTKEATCTEEGVKTYTCSSCKETKTEVIKALGHDYKSVVTEPTETEQGYTTHTCSRCGDSYVDSYTDALGHEHKWDSGKVTKEATCTEEGVKTYTCSGCKETKTEVIKALGHDYQDGVCSRCGDKQQSEVPDPQNPFVDVDKSAYYYDAVLWAYEKKITTGTDATHFSPNATCTRAQSVTFLWRANGEPAPKTTKNPFADVNENDYFYKAVLWAYENGVTSGKSSTRFAPDDIVTRKEFVTFLWRSEGEPEPKSTKNPFVDIPADQFYTKAVLWAYENEVTSGTDATHFSPDGDCLRGQVVCFLYRFFN